MSKEITVVVAGASKIGKTTIATIIQQALAVHGIKGEFSDTNGTSLSSFDSINGTTDLIKRVESVKKHCSVSIKTVTVSRKGKLG